jgi:hypothetical protein
LIFEFIPRDGNISEELTTKIPIAKHEIVEPVTIKGINAA